MSEEIYNKDTPRPVKIGYDGWYPYCPTCCQFDLEQDGKDSERCHWCGQLLDWENLE